jgi:hypothetical protein
MPPKPHGTQRRIIGATLVGEIKCHGPSTSPEPQRCNLRFAGEPLEIGKHSGDELFPARILRCQRGGKEIDKIAEPSRRLRANLLPARRADGLSNSPCRRRNALWSASTSASNLRRPVAFWAAIPRRWSRSIVLSAIAYVYLVRTRLCRNPTTCRLLVSLPPPAIASRPYPGSWRTEDRGDRWLPSRLKTPGEISGGDTLPTPFSRKGWLRRRSCVA